MESKELDTTEGLNNNKDIWCWILFIYIFVICISLLERSVQISSVAQLCPTLCDPMGCSMPVLLVHHKLLELTQTHVHWVSDAIQPSHSLSSPSPPAFNLSQHQGLLKQVILWISRPKYWSYSFSISPFNEYSGLISFRMDWLVLLAVQGTLKSFLQHHSSKPSILQCCSLLVLPYSVSGLSER